MRFRIAAMLLALAGCDSTPPEEPSAPSGGAGSVAQELQEAIEDRKLQAQVTMCQTQVLQISMALERFYIDQAKYPDKLERLVTARQARPKPRPV